MNAGEQHIYAFKSLGIKCHNRLEFPFITVWGSLLRVIQQRAATFISFHQTLFITPTCAPHLQSSCHTKLLPAGSEGEDGRERWRMERKKRKKEGETTRVGFREAVSHLLALILFTRRADLVCPDEGRDAWGGKKKQTRDNGCCQHQLRWLKTGGLKTATALHKRTLIDTVKSASTVFFFFWALGVSLFFSPSFAGRVGRNYKDMI